MVKFLILSDTHGFEKEVFSQHEGAAYPLTQEIPRVDVVLHCGDLTNIGGASSYKKAIRMLGDIDAELKLVIAGNHDLDLDGDFWRANLDEGDEPEDHDAAVDMMTGPFAEAANVMYLTEGIHEFTLKDGTHFKLFASPYQPEFNNWAFGYAKETHCWNIGPDVDIVMTHGPPHGVLDHAHGDHHGCESLLREVQKSAPILHCFGHIHEGYGVENKSWKAQEDEDNLADERIVTTKISRAGINCPNEEEVGVRRGRSTLMVNAAIMNEANRPVNAPWVIELPL